MIRRDWTTGFAGRPWLARLVENRPLKIAAVALAKRIATIAWALLPRGERYRDPVLRTALAAGATQLGKGKRRHAGEGRTGDKVSPLGSAPR